MKAEIQGDGYVYIIAETYAEGFALQLLSKQGQVCEHCGVMPSRFVCDHTEINGESVKIINNTVNDNGKIVQKEIEPLLSDGEVAKELSTTLYKLEMMRDTGDGPEYQIIDGKTSYNEASVELYKKGHEAVFELFLPLATENALRNKFDRSGRRLALIVAMEGGHNIRRLKNIGETRFKGILAALAEIDIVDVKEWEHGGRRIR